MHSCILVKTNSIPSQLWHTEFYFPGRINLLSFDEPSLQAGSCAVALACWWTDVKLHVKPFQTAVPAVRKTCTNLLIQDREDFMHSNSIPAQPTGQVQETEEHT